MNVALIHYWLVRHRGGEAVLEELMDIYPNADVYTNVFRADSMRALFRDRSDPQTTWINKLPFAAAIYPAYVGLMPLALEGLNLNAYDLVVSSESGPAKWVIPAPNARHICYVHTPMRYLWDQRFEYRAKLPVFARPGFDYFTSRLRLSDVVSSHRVDTFVANSRYVADRIARYYHRESTVIHPPVRLEDFGPPQAPEDYYLYAGQLVSYKNVQHAVDACLALGRRLIVVGDGPGSRYVKKFSGQGIEYLGRVGRPELVQLMAKCRALIFPGIEDFGIVPVEVLASGRPVIAVGQGGVLDSVCHGQTGILYPHPSSESLTLAIRQFEAEEAFFDPSKAQSAAQAFSKEAFKVKWTELVQGQTLET